MNFNWDVTKQVLAAAIRWALAALGTFLVTKGIVDRDLADAFLNEWTAIIVGVLILATTALWKYINARYNVLNLIEAVRTPPPPETSEAVAQAVVDVKKRVKEDGISAIDDLETQ